jgi:hypothetical protein
MKIIITRTSAIPVSQCLGRNLVMEAEKAMSVRTPARSFVYKSLTVLIVIYYDMNPSALKGFSRQRITEASVIMGHRVLLP